MDHYFSETPDTDHEVLKITDVVRGKQFAFFTDKGVFSREKVDNGSKLLAESVAVDKADTILDIGCGYGVIGIVLSKFVKRAYMIDINRRAVGLARKNCKLNDCFNAEVLHRDFFEFEDRTFDIVVTNPPLRMGKDYVFRMIERVPSFLQKKGAFYMVARTKQGARSYKKKMEKIFTHCETANKGSGYRVFRGEFHAGTEGTEETG